jgi:hypothetical protein
MPPQTPNPADVFLIFRIRSIFLQDQQLRHFSAVIFVPQRRTKPPFGTSLVQKPQRNLNTFRVHLKSLKKVSTNTPYLLAKTFVATINSSIMPTANKRQGRNQLFYKAVR